MALEALVQAVVLVGIAPPSAALGKKSGPVRWQKDYRGPPLYVRLPVEFETEAGRELLAKGGIPVHRVRKAAYGLPRAGADYWTGVDKDLQSFGWTSMRSRADGSPSQYYRDY